MNKKELIFTAEDMRNFSMRYMEGGDELSDKWWATTLADFIKERDRNNAIAEFTRQYDLENEKK
jgi:predicted transcriptional regulator